MIINPGMSEEAKGGVSSFNGRSGVVTPSSGDYSVDQVAGAAPKASPEFTGSISMGRKSSTAIGNNSIALGRNASASGDAAFSGGNQSSASGFCSHAEGSFTSALGVCAHAEGFSSQAKGNYCHASGHGTIAHHRQVAIGTYNVESNPGDLQAGDRLIVGSGTEDTARSNAFRVHSTGACFGRGAFNTSGADYAELFEWLDGNPEGADRCGHFVTLDGEKIRLAGPGDDLILGIVSGNPSMVGDVHDDQWQGMYLYDVFGRPLWEDVEVPDVTVEEPDPENPGSTVTRVIIPAHIEHRQKLNPAYDGSQPYLPRTQRPEWDAVGMLGKLVAVDDGTCQAGGWCTVGEGGMATHSAARTRYRVMARLDECHVRVLIL